MNNKQKRVENSKLNLTEYKIPCIKNTVIFDEIAKMYGYDPDVEIAGIHGGDYTRIGDKYRYLMRNILYRFPGDYSSNANYMIESDVPVIKELLIRAVSKNKNDIIYQWFNDNVDITDAKECIALFKEVKSILSKLKRANQINEVTYDKWYNTIMQVIGLNTMEKTIKTNEKITELFASILPLVHGIDTSEIILNAKGSDKKYIDSHSQVSMVDLVGKSIEENIRAAYYPNDYLDILLKVIDIITDDIVGNAMKEIVAEVSRQKHFKHKKADTHPCDVLSFASERVIWYQRVYEFLQSHPDKLNEIARDTKMDKNDILNLFRMKNR